MDLKQKVVVVTGAGRGLGRGIATYFAGKGARLACVDLSQEDLDATVAACEAAGGEARAYLANVAKEEEVEKLFNDVVADFGTLHGVVNNAGITRDGLLVKAKDGEVVSKMSLQQWQAVIDVNLTGVFLCGREAAAKMLELGVEEGDVESAESATGPNHRGTPWVVVVVIGIVAFLADITEGLHECFTCSKRAGRS